MTEQQTNIDACLTTMENILTDIDTLEGNTGKCILIRRIYHYLKLFGGDTHMNSPTTGTTDPLNTAFVEVSTLLHKYGL